MENWITFLLVNIVLALAVGILGNFATGWVKSSYERRIFASRAKKIELLKREYLKKKLLSENHVLIVPFAMRDFIMTLTGFIIASMFSVAFIFLFAYFINDPVFRLIQIIGQLFVVGNNAYQMFRSPADLIIDTLAFPSYKEEAREKMKKLGGNPEDLDKEETAGG